MATALQVAFCIIAVGWLGVTVIALLGHRSLPDLPPLADPAGDASTGNAAAGNTAAGNTAAGEIPIRGGPAGNAAFGGGGSASHSGRPVVSVVVATRDEGARLERTVRGLLAQREIELQLIVVDDRSADETPAILERLAAEDHRLEAVRVDDLPDGWLGKCHACHVGAERARGEWLLFVDGDAWLCDDVVARTLRQARIDAADHCCLVPGLGDCTFAGQSVLLMITLALLVLAAGVNRDQRWSYFGVGAFTLMRRAAYEAVGGHRRLRMEIIEDFEMARLVRRAGLRSRLYCAVHDVEVRWAHSVSSFVSVLEKNMFAKLGFQPWRAVANVSVTMLCWAVPIVGVVTGTPAGYCAAGAMASATLPAMWMARRHRWSVLPGLFAPLTLPLLAYATAHSAFRVVRRGGIEWRETFYPLAVLRAGVSEID